MFFGWKKVALLKGHTQKMASLVLTQVSGFFVCFWFRAFLCRGLQKTCCFATKMGRSLLDGRLFGLKPQVFFFFFFVVAPLLERHTQIGCSHILVICLCWSQNYNLSLPDICSQFSRGQTST